MSADEVNSQNQKKNARTYSETHRCSPDNRGREIVSHASRIFPRAHARYGGGRGKGRKNTSGDYSTVFVSNGNVISACGHAIIT